MSEQDRGQTEPSRTEQQITREELEKEADEQGQLDDDATDEGMLPEPPVKGEDAPIGSGGAPIPAGTGMPGDEGAPGTGDQNAQQGHTP